MVREALRAETEGNNYGTTVSFLQSQICGGDRVKIKAILDSAEWAKFQFGRYYYVSKETPIAEANDCTEVAPDNTAMPIERTESDYLQTAVFLIARTDRISYTWCFGVGTLCPYQSCRPPCCN